MYVVKTEEEDPDLSKTNFNEFTKHDFSGKTMKPLNDDAHWKLRILTMNLKKWNENEVEKMKDFTQYFNFNWPKNNLTRYFCYTMIIVLGGHWLEK